MTIRAIFFAALIAQGVSALHAGPKGGAANPAAQSRAGDAVAPNQLAPSQQPGNKKGTRYTKPLKKDLAVQTFTGTVEWEYKPLAWDCDVPNCDHFALYDDATHRNYELDDARAALPFEGQRAKVTGTVDIKDSIIHVVSMESVK